MPTTKEQLHKIVDDLPDNCTLKDLLYYLYVHEKVNRGVEDFKAGRTVPHEVVKKEMREWLLKLNGQKKRARTSKR